MAKDEAGVTVRGAEPGDAEAIDRVIRYLDAFHAEARPDLFRTPAGKPRGEDFLDGVLEDPLQAILVGLQADQVMGYVHVRARHTPASSYRVERRYGEIDSLAVLPEAQRCGLGRELVAQALEWLIRQGIDDHQIAFHAFNEPALRLYRQFGFAPSVTMLRRKG